MVKREISESCRLSTRAHCNHQGRALRRAFKGLGTAIELRIWPEAGRERLAAGRLACAVRFLRLAEDRFSRFNPKSELSRLNRSAGTPRRVSRLTFAVIRAALTAAEATEGLFDPTILQALIAAGYDRSFDMPGQRAQPNGVPTRHGRPFVGQWRNVRLDSANQAVWLPPGVGLDLGGIAKGWLADRVLRSFCGAGAAYADLGGDIALSSPPTGTDTWRIEIEGPRGSDRVVASMQVTGGGIATSGITRRAWSVGGEARHHLIDPRSGRPAETDLLSVTVAAPSAAAAEVAAKATLLLGAVAGRRALLLNQQLAGVLVPASGGPIIVGDCDGSVLAPTWETPK